MSEALLALGGNVGDSRALLDRAITALCDDDTVRLTARSPAYRTPPWGGVAQNPFVNLCIAVETTLTPQALLEHAQQVERELGRDRSRERHWGPRTVDIDILWYDDLALDEPGLTLPHPRLFERGFVLVPLADIAGDRRIGGRLIADEAAKADRSGIEKLPAA